MSHASSSVRELPPLPPALTQLLKAVNSPDTSIEDLVTIIERDPALTARLLHLANSAYYGLNRRISAIRPAVVLLGRNTVANMARSLTVLAVRDGMDPDGPLRPIPFWQHAFGVGCAARGLSRYLSMENPDEAFVAGLMHDVGKVLLMSTDAQAYAALVHRSEAEQVPLHVLERQTFAVDHARVGAAVCRRWHFPDEISQAVQIHHGTNVTDPSERAYALATVIGAANRMIKLMDIGESGNAVVQDEPLPSPTTVSPVEIDADALGAVRDIVREEIQAAQQAFGS